MPQGFHRNRHKVNRDEQERWAFWGHTIREDPLPDHPDILPLIIRALLSRLANMDRSNSYDVQGIQARLASLSVGRMRKDVRALLKRIERLDRTRNKDLARRIGVYISVIAYRCRWPSEIELNWLYSPSIGHYEDLFEDELRYIGKERLTAFSCIPAVLRLQRDYLYECMGRSNSLKCGSCRGILVEHWMDEIHSSDFRCVQCGQRWVREGYTENDTPRTWLIRNQKRLYEELTFYPCACRYHPNFNAVDLDQRGPGEMIPAILAGLHKGSTAASIRQCLKTSARPSKVPPFLA
ncbi:MAG: hypothetical protein MRJ68_04470 [Nitrospira sp.]|nr:hypothetical protein [Nitrospira sp.]